ncbi:MAG: hypothetical protein Q8P07_00140 [bacterium]|nr:hypothetical protein [bacterium]
MEPTLGLRIYWADENTLEVALRNGLGKPDPAMKMLHDVFKEIEPEHFMFFAEALIPSVLEKFPEEKLVLTVFLTVLKEAVADQMTIEEVLAHNENSRNLTGGARETGLYVTFERLPK